jgi:hypothetical protein
LAVDVCDKCMRLCAAAVIMWVLRAMHAHQPTTNQSIVFACGFYRDARWVDWTMPSATTSCT